MQHLLKHFDHPDEVREFPKGRLEIVTVNGSTVGRATYQPGWKWSEHVRPTAGTELCEVEHLGVVISGHAVAAMNDGTIVDLTPGTLFYIPATPHDSWVVGDEQYCICRARRATRSEQCAASTAHGSLPTAHCPLISDEHRRLLALLRP